MKHTQKDSNNTLLHRFNIRHKLNVAHFLDSMTMAADQSKTPNAKQRPLGKFVVEVELKVLGC